MKKITALLLSLVLLAAALGQPTPPASGSLTVNSQSGAITAPVSAALFKSANDIGSASASVTSITGTANQITASASTGAVTLSLAGPHNFTSLTSTAVLLGGGTSAINASDLTYSTPTLTVPDSFAISSAGSIAFTAGGSNKNIVFSPSGSGGVVVSSTSSLIFGATALASVNVSADTTAGILQLVSPTSGTMTFTTAGALSLTLSGGAAASITGGAGDMTITGGTGNSRQIILRTTTSVGTATTALTLTNTQNATLVGDMTISGGDLTLTGTSTITGGTGNMTITGGTGNSRTITLRPTSSGGSAFNGLVLNASGAVVSTSASSALTLGLTGGNSSVQGVAGLSLVAAPAATGNSFLTFIATNSAPAQVTAMTLSDSTLTFSPGGTTAWVFTAGGGGGTVQGGVGPDMTIRTANNGGTGTTMHFQTSTTAAAQTEALTLDNVQAPNFFPAFATPANVNAGARIMMGSAKVSIYIGTGAPSTAAVKGSVYIRTDATTTTTRLYVNTDGSTSWASFTTSS